MKYTFMAIATGRESTEGGSAKRYIGVAPVTVLAVNPSKKELEEIYQRDIEADPVYLSEIEVGEDQHKVQSVRIDFILRTVQEKKCNIDLITKASFFLRRVARSNKDKTKIQIVDKYGRFGWATEEEAARKTIPNYKNGPANIDKDYRIAYTGEEQLTGFIRNYLNIPEPMSYVKGTWVPNTKFKPEECECRLVNILDYFGGDFSELSEIIKLQPNNRVKAMFGVKTAENNKQYQAVFTELFPKNNVTDYSRLDKLLQERKANGAYSNTEFNVEDLKEYAVQATEFDNNTDEAPQEAAPWD